MRNRIVIFLLFLSPFQLFSQYATKGAGALKNEIWWFDWAGLTIADGTTRTYNTGDGMTVKITLSNVLGELKPDVMNTWSGAMLHYLYNFDDPAIKPTIHSKVPASGDRKVTLTIEVRRAGVLVPFTFVASDGEASTDREWTILTTTGSPWQTIEYYQKTTEILDPLVGCGTKTVRIYQTLNPPFINGRNPLLVTNSADGNMTVDMKMERHVDGGMAVAFGIMAPADRGDLPASYGNALHQLYYNVINGCNYIPPFPAIQLAQPLYIGTVPGDADGYEITDDNSVGNDEEGIASFPIYDNAGTYSLPVKVFNETGKTAYLSGYFDANRNGKFDAGEAVHATVPDRATVVNLSWTGLPVWLPTGSAKGYGFRFRISSDKASAQLPTGTALDGEVEDYFIKQEDWCNIQVQTVNDISVCPGKPVQLFTTGTNVTKYSWDKSIYLDNPNIAAPTAKAEAATTYTVTGSNPQGCEAKDAVTISMLPLPVITTSGDISICRNSSTTLTANAPNAAKYSWQPATGLNNPAISNPIATPASETEYTVEVEGLNGCVASSKLKLNFWPVPVFNVSPQQTEVCKNETIELKASGADEYTWLSKDNLVLATTPVLTVKPDAPQAYKINMKSLRCGETGTFSVPVAVNPLPKPLLTKSNDLDCKTGNATLRATGGVSYRWDALPGITDLNSSSPLVNPLVNTKYYVTVTSAKGCTAKDSIVVQVDYTESISTYPVPTAFTPNNDGKNDCFGLKQWGNITALEFSVFNRWGQRLFQTKDPLQCWDGRFNGEQQPAAGYIYQIKATTTCGTAFRKGIVMLIR